jgi:anti-sigma regulatory factor (Ser/Thr protein kinase)
MTPRPRSVVFAAAILLLVLLVLLTMAVLTYAALPVLLVMWSGLLALAVGIRARAAARTRARRTDPCDASAESVAAEGSTPAHSVLWSMRWDSEPPVSALPVVRQRLAAVLAEWGLEGEAREPTLLVVTELLSNAVEHAHPPVRLTVGFPDNSVRVEVQDATTAPPRLQPHDPRAQQGRGLRTVQALSLNWGWTNHPGGKTVWAEVSIGWP